MHDTAEAAGDPSATDHGNGTSARSASGGHHSAIEPTDRHELAERRFADEAVALLVKHSRQNPIGALVVVAPPHTLAELRRTLPQDLKKVLIAEIDKDLTRHTTYEIERHLTA